MLKYTEQPRPAHVCTHRNSLLWSVSVDWWDRQTSSNYHDSCLLSIRRSIKTRFCCEMWQ